jgi:hypothetical protein
VAGRRKNQLILEVERQGRHRGLLVAGRAQERGAMRGLLECLGHDHRGGLALVVTVVSQ